MTKPTTRGGGVALLCLFPLLLAAAPPIPAHTVLQPTFRVDGGAPKAAGRAFVVDLDGSPVVVSALHLLGPAGGHITGCIGHATTS